MAPDPWRLHVRSERDPPPFHHTFCRRRAGRHACARNHLGEDAGAGCQSHHPRDGDHRAKLAGIESTETEREALVNAANRALTGYEAARAIDIPNDVSPPFHFSSTVPGIEVDKTVRPFRLSAAPAVRRPANLEDVAFWPVRHLAELIRTKKVTSLELTEMYLERLHRYNAKLNNVVTFLDDQARTQAKQADAEIAAANMGPLHGIPWGAKDIITVKGYKTTWNDAAEGSGAGLRRECRRNVARRRRGAGGEAHHRRTRIGRQLVWRADQEPMDPAVGSSGSSAGPSSATAAGCVAFAIGSEPADRFSVRRRGAGSPVCGRPSGASAVTAAWHCPGRWIGWARSAGMPKIARS